MKKLHNLRAAQGRVKGLCRHERDSELVCFWSINSTTAKRLCHWRLAEISEL